MLMTEHGGNPLAFGNVTDFSANINPMGISESVRRAFIRSADELEKYPDPYCIKLREKLAERLNISEKNIVCGNGADDIIYRIVHAFRPRRALLCAPTFSEYSKALSECGCEITEHFLSEKNDFEVDSSLFEKLHDVDMFFLCSPNNPTGRTASQDVLAETAEICLKRDILLVCDESFLDFAGRKGIMPYINGNAVILRSMTKTFAIPGVRLGYAVFDDTEKAAKTASAGQFWSVSSPAQACGIAALDESEYLIKSAAYIKTEREYLINGLEKYVEKVYPSDANFILFKAENNLDDKLFSQGILIRNCSNYSGLSSGFFRVAVRSHKENKLLINAFRRLRNG